MRSSWSIVAQKDNTRQICGGFSNVKFHEQAWLGFGAQKQKGVDLAKNEWVFVLDSDEVITNELRDEIISTLKEPKFMAYNVARLNFFFGKAIKNMGLYPDYTVRLFNKNFAKFDGRAVHEKVVLMMTQKCLGRLKTTSYTTRMRVSSSLSLSKITIQAWAQKEIY